MKLTRRMFLGGAAVATAFASIPLGRVFGRRYRAGTFGELVPDPDGILDLPAGFTYRILETAGDDMTDGYRVPGRPDGMACFANPGGGYVLMRNHEVSAGDLGNGPYKLGQTPPPQAYDASGMGGVTRLVLDANLDRVSSNLVLIGTVRNCAGGPSPWGWLTCEENVDAGHGYVFLCPDDAAGVQEPQRIVGYGRYNHEAVAIDPATHIAYLTEDRGNSCLYRFVPDAFDTPFVGTLQALKIAGESVFNTSTGLSVGDSFAVEWVDIDDPDPSSDSVRIEAQGKGAAIISRGEGIWYGGGLVYICSTNGGPIGKGQIFALDIAAQTLTLVAQSTDADVLDNPDNIAVAPWGDLYMAEDGAGQQYLRVLSATGEVTDFARNALSGSELAGVCFSPDGKALFVNIQGDGLTLAVTGAFPEVDPPTEPDAGPDDPGPTDRDAGPTDPGADSGSDGGDESGGCRVSSGEGLSIGPMVVAAGLVAAGALRRDCD